MCHLCESKLIPQILLSRRVEVKQLVEEGDEGMIHSVLSSLPDLYEEEDRAVSAESEDMGDDTALVDVVQTQTTDKGDYTSITSTSEDPMDVSDDSRSAASVSFMSETSSSVGDDESTAVGGDSDDEDNLNKKVADSLVVPAEPSALLEPPSSNPSPDPSQLDEELSEKRPRSRASTTNQPDELPPRPRVSLTSLLMQADDLYARFPPSHPSIALSSIMGPQSVMLTWSEDPSELPSDDDAELMVTKPELIVLPYIEPDDEVASDDEETHGKHRGRRRPRKPRHLVLQRKTMVAGAVLVLGVAVAVYGIQNGSSAGLFRSFAESQQHRSSVGREWKRMSSLVGGLVLGVGERIFEPLWH